VRRWILFVIVPLAVILGGLVLAIMILTSPPRIKEAAIYNDSTLTPLPQDRKAAQKELQQMKAALAKFRPGGRYIVINTHANKVVYRTEDSIIIDATCSTGSGGQLTDSITGRHWVFDTPRGVFKIDSKLKEPWWRKPDWAYIEEEEKIPRDESERYDPEMLGAYAVGFGDGYFIHGTIYERLLGISVTHGCVRLGSADIEKLYKDVKMGTPVYVF